MIVTAIFSFCGYRSRELDLTPVLGIGMIVLVVVLMAMAH